MAKGILKQIYDEAPHHWPNGLNAEGFDGGLWIVMKKQSSTRLGDYPVGFVGFQERMERNPGNRKMLKIGYYSIGILPEHRCHGFAKKAVARLLAIKAASVDCVRAMIVNTNSPSLALANSLSIPVVLKKSASQDWLTRIPGLLARATICG